MKTFAQIAAEDRKMMKSLFRGYVMTPAHAKAKRAQELEAESFRVKGLLDNIGNNGGTRRETVSKRGWL